MAQDSKRKTVCPITVITVEWIGQSLSEWRGAGHISFHRVPSPSGYPAPLLQVLEQALGSSVVANAETGQLWAARAVPATGAPIAHVWRALEALHALEQPLAWLADQLLVRDY